MDIITTLHKLKLNKYDFTLNKIESINFYELALLVKKRRRLINSALLVLDLLSKVNLSQESILNKILDEVGNIKKSYSDITFLNVVIVNHFHKVTNNLFFANDALRMEVNFLNIDDTDKKIYFSKTSYIFSLPAKKLIAEKIADSLGYELKYVNKE